MKNSNNITINGSVETLNQMIQFIESLDNSHYQSINTAFFESSIGQHLRHILDLFHALIRARDNSDSIVNYDIRRRGIALETNKSLGLIELHQVKVWLTSLDPNTFNTAVKVTTEVELSQQSVDSFISSFGRELSFAASHLTHHLALMAVIAKTFGLHVDTSLGLAPATASYLRAQPALDDSKNLSESAPCAH